MNNDKLSAIHALIEPPDPPERIHGWENTHMSIARFYGGITYNGHGYTIAIDEPGQPLVRNDVLQREIKEKQKAERKRAKNAQREIEP